MTNFIQLIQHEIASTPLWSGVHGP